MAKYLEKYLRRQLGALQVLRYGAIERRRHANAILGMRLDSFGMVYSVVENSSSKINFSRVLSDTQQLVAADNGYISAVS
jgi:hypothetical protein